MFYKKRCFRSDPEYIYRQDGEYFLGHLVDYPDYVTPHGKSLEELKENLRDLNTDLMSNEIPYISKFDEEGNILAKRLRREILTI